MGGQKKRAPMWALFFLLFKNTTIPYTNDGIMCVVVFVNEEIKMSKSELVVETPFGDTLDDMFKFYLGRDIPTCVPKNVEIAVSQDVYDELQHIKDRVQKTYSLGIPTKDLDTDTIVKLFAIENRHKDILCDILDAFTINK